MRQLISRRANLFILEYLKQLKTVTQLMINKTILGLITRSFNQNSDCFSICAKFKNVSIFWLIYVKES